MRAKPPCKGCMDRTITCHSVCRRYQEWKKEIEEFNARRREELQKNVDPICERSIRKGWANNRYQAQQYRKKKK